MLVCQVCGRGRAGKIRAARGGFWPPFQERHFAPEGAWKSLRAGAGYTGACPRIKTGVFCGHEDFRPFPVFGGHRLQQSDRKRSGNLESMLRRLGNGREAGPINRNGREAGPINRNGREAGPINRNGREAGPINRPSKQPAKKTLDKQFCFGYNSLRCPQKPAI